MSMSRNQCVVVTGAAAGIGAAVAVELLEQSWTVVAVDRAAGGLRRLARKWDGRAVPVEGDAGDPDTHDRACKAAESAGILAGWVNNAGIERPTRAHDYDRANFEQMLRINLHGYMFGCSAACRSFLRLGVAGAIVNVSSIRSLVSFPGGFVYETTKGGVDAMTRQIAVEYGHLGIRCNAVRPGGILTPLTQADIDASKRPAAFKKQLGDLHPLQRRMGRPEEVAAVVAFLLSPKASFITGECVNVDGGAMARCYAYPPDPAVKFAAVATNR